MGKSAKGGAYERETCKLLSTWWSGGVADDWFWRSAGSGGRATNRAKSGKTTYGQNGDIAATHPKGEKLTRLFCIELKRGYSKWSFADVIDRQTKAGQTPFEAFLEQAMRSATNEGTAYWMLIHRRDRKEALVFVPYEVFRRLKLLGAFPKPLLPSITFEARVRLAGKARKRVKVWAVPLTLWVENIQPAQVKQLHHASLK